ncbi:hypothetical protein AZZ76_003087, partial [Klebsiella pneumoniae]
ELYVCTCSLFPCTSRIGKR